jgi:hypothetical protein
MNRILTFYPLIALLVAGPIAGESSRLPLEGEELETFLRTAEIVDRETLQIGVTRSQRVTLKDGEHSTRAIWKTIEEYESFKRFDDGSFEMGFVDSYKNEIAAYELDKLIDLGLVPAVVERRVGRERGAMQLWVEGTVMETDRIKRGLRPEDPESWNQQMFKVRLFHNLTCNTDFNNMGNILSDADSRIYLIDHSRAFRTTKELLSEGDLTRFSRSVLESLRGLDNELLQQQLGRWLSKKQIAGLLARRDLILKHADRLIALGDQAEILYP